MKHRWTALLLALLCGCTARTETPEAPAELPTPPPVVQEEVPPPLEEPEKSDQLTIDGNIAAITLAEGKNFDRLFLKGLKGVGELTICINDNEIYKQENESADRWCWLGEQNTDTITVHLPENGTITEFQLSASAEGAPQLFTAYLPYTSFDERMLTDGSLSALDEVTINVGCYWLADGSLEVKNGLGGIFEKIHSAYPELDIFCTINPKKGGAAAIMTPEKRSVLIENMLAFCSQHQLSGVDIDWEFPAEDQWDEFSLFLCELSEQLDSASLRLSTAFYPEDVTLSDDAIKSLHKVNVMAYDQFDEQGRHSTYKSAVEAIEYFLSLGFEPGQLSLGLPAYGRPLSGEAAWPLYLEYAEQLSDGTNLLHDNYFNSPQLVQDKSVLAQEMNLQGVFLYHLGCDLPGNDSRSLTASIRQTIK